MQVQPGALEEPQGPWWGVGLSLRSPKAGRADHDARLGLALALGLCPAHVLSHIL